MSMSKLSWVTLVLICCVHTTFAQPTTEFFTKPYRQGNGISVRMGLNYSMPTVTAYYINSSIPTSILWGVRPKAGFYLGASYYSDLLTNRLSLRIDATGQMKSTANIDLTGNLVLRSRYFYIGLRPMVGLQLTKQLTVYSGVEANLLTTSQNSFGGAVPLNVGASLRCSYRIRSLGIEIGYYRGFTRYDRLNDFIGIGGAFQHDFYNQTLETGLIYYLK